jgi:hypothetical protein
MRHIRDATRRSDQRLALWLLEVREENMYVNGRCFLPFKLDYVAWPGRAIVIF